MEGSDGIFSENINFNRSSIDFGNRLNFNVISPLPILSLELYVIFYINGDIILEKTLFIGDVVHAKFPYFLVVVFVTVKLVGNGPKQAVSVTVALLDHHFLAFQTFNEALRPLLQ